MVNSEEDKGVRLVWDDGHTLVSAQDVPLCLETNMWMDDGYVRISGCHPYHYLHNLLLRHSDPARPIDHINECTWDNRRSNLRIVTRAYNTSRPWRADDAEEVRILQAHANGELDIDIHEWLRKRRESRKL